jgi:hypothetical protein
MQKWANLTGNCAGDKDEQGACNKRTYQYNPFVFHGPRLTVSTVEGLVLSKQV